MSWQVLFHIDMFHGYIPQILIAELIFFLGSSRKVGGLKKKGVEKRAQMTSN